MALYKVYMRFGSDLIGQPIRKWSNSYYLDAPSAVAAASTFVVSWNAFLSSACRERVWCYEVYATDLVPGTDNFATVPVPLAQRRGQLPTPIGADPYLPKVCVAVTLTVPGSRPSRKFFRPGLYESDVNSGVGLNTVLLSDITGAFTDFIGDLSPLLVDPDGQEVTGVQKVTLTTREFGRESTADVPAAPPTG